MLAMANISSSTSVFTTPPSYAAVPPFSPSPTRRSSPKTLPIRAQSSTPAPEEVAAAAGIDPDLASRNARSSSDEQQSAAPAAMQASADPEEDRWWESLPSDDQPPATPYRNHFRNKTKNPALQKKNWYLSKSFVSDVITRVRLADASREGVAKALEGWREPLTPRNIATVIIRVDGWKRAYHFFEWLKSRGDYNIDTYLHNVMLNTLQKAKQWELCEQLAEQMISEGFVPDNFTYSILINCAKRCHLPDKAIEWFERMSTTDCVPDHVTYNSILGVLGSCGRTQEAIELYEKLKKSGWQPDSVTCGTMANVYAKMDDHWAIERLYWDMKDIGVEPNVVYYNTYIKALSASGRLTLAVSTFRQMEEAGVRPTTVTLSIMIEMYTRVGAIHNAFELFERLQHEGLVVDVMVYNALLAGCTEHALISEAEELMERMREQGIQPTEGTYRCLMSVYASKGVVNKVREIFDKLQAEGYKPGILGYNCLIRACKQGLEFEKVPEYFYEMLDRGYEPNEWMCGSLLACISACKTGEASKRIMRCIDRCNPKVHCLVEKLLDGEEVEVEWLQEQVNTLISEFQPETRRPLLNTLIELCWQRSRGWESQQILQIGRSTKVYDNMEIVLDSEWRLILRTLSFSSAECALQIWLNSIYKEIRNDQELPAVLVIETGSGKRRMMDKERLNGFIYSILKKLGAPFEENVSEIGTFKATASAVRSWLDTGKGYPFEDLVESRYKSNPVQNSSLNTI